jgi:hypothetical protein
VEVRDTADTALGDVVAEGLGLTGERVRLFDGPCDTDVLGELVVDEK